MGTKAAALLTASAVAVFFWLFFLYAQRTKEPISPTTKSLWMAVFYTAFIFFFRIKEPRPIITKATMIRNRPAVVK